MDSQRQKIDTALPQHVGHRQPKWLAAVVKDLVALNLQIIVAMKWRE